MIAYKKATLEDYDDYYFIRCDENNIHWAGHTNKPDYNNLKKWYIENINKQTRVFFLVYLNNEIAGYIYLDILTPEQDLFEAAHGVLESMNGKGIGTGNMKFAKEYIDNHFKSRKELQGWVAFNNYGAQKILNKNSFVKTDETKEIFLPQKNENVKFDRWVYRFP